GGTEGDSGGNHGVGGAAAVWSDMPGDDLRASREGDAFADAEHDPKHEQRSEAADKPHQQGASRPQEDANRHQPVNREAIAQPSREQLHRRINPEESGEGETVGFFRQAKLGFHFGSRYANRAAVDIIEEDRGAQKE